MRCERTRPGLVCVAGAPMVNAAKVGNQGAKVRGVGTPHLVRRVRRCMRALTLCRALAWSAQPDGS